LTPRPYRMPRAGRRLRMTRASATIARGKLPKEALHDQ
jgi:hypothetical protein